MPHAPVAARLAACRAELAFLDVTLIVACERAAGRGRRGLLPPPDLKAWDRATWRRTLNEARVRDRLLGRRMRRLEAEIGTMERDDPAR